jgi:hypothetical protein
MMEKNDTLHIEFGQNLKNFIPEFLARMLIMLFVLLGFRSVGEDAAQQIFFIVLFFVFNIVLFLLTIYGTGRRKVSILNFIEMRLKVDEKYGNSRLEYSSDFNHTPFYFYVALSAIVFCISVFSLYINRYIKFYGTDEFYFIITTIILTFIYGLTLRHFRMNFISKKIIAVTHNGKKYSAEEVEAFMTFLYDEKQEAEGYYVNDGLIYELERNANIYKQRVETLLIEAVFIGALTFGTFIQLTSPESIGSFREIDEIEMQANGLDLDTLSAKKHAADFNSLVEVVKTGKINQAIPKAAASKFNFGKKKIKKTVSKRNNPFAVAYDLTKNQIRSYIQGLAKQKNKDTTQSQGIFQGWALQRQYNIFSFFYKDKINDGIPNLFSIDSGNKAINDLETDINRLKQKLKIERDTLLNKETDSSNYHRIATANIKAMSSGIGQDLIRKLDQLELVKMLEIHGDRIYTLPQDKRAAVLRILHKHDNDKFIKYYCITKTRWDEQEYLFLIAIGSIICSVLYISVLINRFVIILKIETLFSEINKAMAWNRREEDALSNEVRSGIEGNNQVVLNEFIKKRKYYTEKLQIQLAKCSQIGTKIETNIQVATFVRSIGLYTFFVVLLVGTMMLDPKFTFVLSFILIYAMVGSAFMQEGSNIRSVWHIFTKNNAD